MNIRSLSRDLWLLRTLRNGAAFVLGFRTGAFPSRAIFLDGFELKHPPGLSGLAEALVEVLHERVYTPAWFYTPEPHDTILDFGANIGVFAVGEARRNPTARIVAVEAHPTIFEQLKQNVRALGGRIQLVHAALQAADGTVQMSQPTTRSLDIRVDDSPSKGSVAVPAIDFAHAMRLVGDGDVAFLKCDIEGAERSVFGAVAAHDIQRIKNIAIEYHDDLRPGTSQKLWEWLSPTHRLLHLLDNGGCGIMLWKRLDLIDAAHK